MKYSDYVVQLLKVLTVSPPPMYYGWYKRGIYRSMLTDTKILMFIDSIVYEHQAPLSSLIIAVDTVAKTYYVNKNANAKYNAFIRQAKHYLNEHQFVEDDSEKFEAINRAE